MVPRIAVTAAAVSFVTLSATAQPVSDADAKQAAAQVSQKFADAYNAAKPADIAALFVSGGVYLTPGGTMLTNHQEMTSALAARQKAGWTREAINVVEAHPQGNDVLAIVTYEIEGTGTNSGKTIGGYAAQLLTREGSDWKLKLLAGTLKPVQDVTAMSGATAK